MSHSRPANPWPLVLVALGLAFVLLASWSIYRAGHAPGCAVVQEYRHPGTGAGHEHRRL